MINYENSRVKYKDVIRGISTFCCYIFVTDSHSYFCGCRNAATVCGNRSRTCGCSVLYRSEDCRTVNACPLCHGTGAAEFASDGDRISDESRDTQTASRYF